MNIYIYIYICKNCYYNSQANKGAPRQEDQ